MKKRIAVGLAIGICAMTISGAAHAALLTMEDVGLQDTLIASGKVNSGDSNELDWVNKQIFGADYLTSGKAYYTEMTKTETEEGAGWVAIDDGDSDTRIYAYNFQSVEPAYFFIKTAASNSPGESTDVDHYLYFNIGNLSYGVIDLNMANLVDIYSIGKLSHIGEVGTSPVPEPATMMLFGVGLAGLAGVRRRAK